jgi:hypothetical protein
MVIKGITDEDFINYKVPSMFIATAHCSFKCDKEYGLQICQNGMLAQLPDIAISLPELFKRYTGNPITKAVVFGGLEPFDDFAELLKFVYFFRNGGWDDDIVIYTGYTKEELENAVWDAYLVDHVGLEKYWNSSPLNCISALQHFPNIVIKFGRYIPDQTPHYDPVLGICLASDNQYAERIS